MGVWAILVLVLVTIISQGFLDVGGFYLHRFLTCVDTVAYYGFIYIFLETTFIFSTVASDLIQILITSWYSSCSQDVVLFSVSSFSNFFFASICAQQTGIVGFLFLLLLESIFVPTISRSRFFSPVFPQVANVFSPFSRQRSLWCIDVFLCRAFERTIVFLNH